MLKEKFSKLNKKKLIVLITVVLSLLLFFLCKNEVNNFNIKGITNRFTNYQYYDENTVFVLYTKYLDENNIVLAPTVVETRTIDNLSYEIDIPQVDGYTSEVQELKGNLDEAGLEYLKSLDYVKIIVKDNIYNIYITINYSSIQSSYTIEYYEQDSSLTGYTKVEEEVVGMKDGEYTGEVVTGETVTISPKERPGFTLNTSETEMTGRVEANGAKIFKAYYDRSSYYFYTYNTGDLYYEPIEIIYGQTLDSVDEPTYSGYTFNGWKYFKDLEGEEIEKPETMPAYDLYAEAQWKSDATHYTLSYYTENANDNGYINIGTYQVDATSGENLSEKDLTSTIETGFSTVMGDTAEFYHYNEEKTKEQNDNFDIIVEGSGVTIVAIYYDRNVYNLELNFNDESYTTKAEVEINGKSYTESYTFQAKYDQDITGLWLKADNFVQFPINSTTQLYFEGWSPTWSTSTTYTSMRLTVTSDMIYDSTNGSTQVYIAKYLTSNTTKVMHYMFESLDQETTTTSETRLSYKGKYYDSELSYKQTVYSTSTSWRAKQIAGFTSVGIENNGTDFYFYYDRNTYNITLYNMNNIYVEKEMKYGQSLEELMNLQLKPEDFTLETPGTKEWVFDGWYQDSNFLVPVVWTNEDGSYKTVTDRLVLYAKWLAPTYTITFNTDGGTWTDSDSQYNKVDDNTYTLMIEEGTSLTKPQNPTKKGYIAQRWYYDVGENSFEYLFSESQKVYSDLSLTVQYKANSNISYRVRYIEAQYENGELIEDVSEYTNIVDVKEPKEVHQNTFGTIVTEYSADIYDSENANNYYVVNVSKQELLLDSENIEDNVIYFIYAKNPVLDYTIYHVKYKEDEQGNPIKYADGEVPEETELLGKTTTSVAAGYVVANAEEFKGWTVIGEESQTLTLKLNEELNTIYFYYSENEMGEYVVNFFFKGENGVYSETPTYTYASQDLAGKVIYATEFDKFVWENGATEADYIGKVLDEEKTKGAYLIITTTDEISAMNIYYKNRSDISYTVRYLDENGNSLIEDKVVDGQTYLSYITEKAEVIDGYKLITGESDEKTIQLELSGNEITFNYEIETNLDYVIKYIDSETKEEIKEQTMKGGQVFNAEVTETAPNIDGYNILEAEKTIIIGTGLNEIVFEYTKRTDLSYTVEYYYNDKIDNSYTETFVNQTFKTEITECTEKEKLGYKLDRIETLPMTIGIGENVIRVYYVSDETQTKEISYNVEYYKDGVLADTETHTQLIQLLEEDILDVQKNNINTTNKYEGYYFLSTEPEVLPDQISAGETIKVNYEIRKDLNYTIKYVDKDTKEEIKASDIKENQTYQAEIKEIAPSIDGYVPVETEKTITIELESNEIIFEYAKRTDLSYTIKYLDMDTNEEIKTSDIKENQTYKSEVTETAPDIEGYKKTNLEETITITTETNEIIFYYDRIDGLPYKVNYYIEGTEEKVAETKVVEENAYGDKITETAIEIDGYYKVEPSTQEITIGLTENVINFYYTIREDLSYRVEYYFNGELDESKTDIFENQTFKTEITEYTDKVEKGYKLDKAETIPMTIGTGENIIKVYYVTDPNQKKTLKYTVEYYKDGVLADTEETTKSVQWLEADIIEVDKTKINTLDKYEGYYFINTEPEEIPDEVTTEEIIKVNYEIRKDLSYTIKYLDAETGLELKTADIIENQTYQAEIKETAPSIDGYVPVETEKTIVIGLETNEIVFEYTNRTDLTYRVEYYYNNELDESKTENFEGLTFKTEITKYTEKLEKGYKLDRVESLPMIIGTEDNVIRVYYVPDPNQKKTLKYTVEYYKDGILADTDVVSESVQWLEDDIITVDKTQINVDNKFEGYYFISTEPEEIPDEVANEEVIKVNYEIRKDLSYTIKYINIETGESLLPEETIENQTYNTKVTHNAPEVIGYLPEKDNITITIGIGTNEIIFNYEIAKNLSYTVNYFEEGTENKAAESKVVEGKTYGEIVEETAIEIDGYNKLEPSQQNLTIEMKDNVINFYYARRTDLKYTVEYYFNDVLAEEKTDIFENQTFKTKITTYTNKVEKGYKVGKTENLPLTISTDETANVIKVYYVTDESQRKELKYTVEYYKDGILADSEEETKDVQYLEPENMAVNVEKINTTDKYEGYYFLNTEPEIIPDEVMNGDVIKVNYTVRTDLSYTVKYIDAETGLELKSPDIKENQTYNSEIVETAPTIDGYVPVETEKTIVIGLETNEIVFEYTNRTDLTYRVEYYYNNELDESKTENFEGLTFKTEISEYTNKPEKGYMFDRAETVPMIIGTGDNVIKVYYVTDPNQTKELSYKVQYYKDGKLSDTDTEKIKVQYLEPETMAVNKEKINITDKYDGYYFSNTEPEEIPDEVTNGDIIKVNYTIRTDLSYTIKYLDIETGEELKPEETKINQTYNSKVTEVAPDIEGYKKVNETETITITTKTNEIIFNYKKIDGLVYTVNYYEEGTEESIAESKSVEGNVFGDIVEESAIEIDGYNKVEPSTQSISIGVGENIINFYYTKRTDLKYTVEYYFNDVIAEEKTDIFENQTFKTEIAEYTNKVEKGYKVGNVENFPLTISTDENANIIKVYYVTDPNQKKTLKYTVEYYKDGVLSDSEENTKSVQWLESDIIEVDKTKINTFDKYEGYYFINTEPEEILDEVTTEEIIKVNYEIRKDLSYTIKYLDAETGLELKATDTKENQTYNSEILETAPSIDGYVPVETEKTIVIGLETNEIVFEYTNRTDLTYRVEYYYNNELDESKTENFEGLTFKTEITEYTDKVEKGYKLGSVETVPMIIGTGDNVIKVYYVTDETQRKELKYTVEYYKDEVLADSEEEIKDVQYLEPENMVVNKEKINITDKYDGYYFSNTEPEEIPDEVVNGDIIKVNYTVRTDLSYTVKYVDVETQEDLLPEKLIENQTYNTSVTEVAPKVTGYSPVEESKTIIITTGMNEIVFEYEIAKNLSYTVNYYEEGTENSVLESKIVEGKTFGEIVSEVAMEVDGYNKVEPTNQEITIGMEENIINFYYARRTDLKYTVEYYFNDVIAEEKTDIFENQTFKTEITEYTDKVEKGYKLENAENLPLTISTDETANVIKVYYVTDESQRKELKYTVEYYKDGVFADSEEETKDVQYLEPENMAVNVEKINTLDKYEGYYFSNTEPEIIPDEVMNGDVIKVNYTVRTDLSYIVKYLDAATGLELKSPDIKENQTYQAEIKETAPSIDGYVPVETEKTIVIGLDVNEIVFEYTNRTDLTYRVEYYYNNELDESKTENFEGLTFKTEITEYIDKVEKGYKLGSVENVPMIIGTEENVIRVYYVPDPNQKKTLKYTVEYYKDGILTDSENETKDVQYLEPEIIAVNKEKINTTDKYEGYYFLNTEPEIIPDEVMNGDVIKVNYTVRTDLSYTVKYIDVETGNELKPEETKTNQTYNTEVTESAPSIDGYVPVEPEKTIRIGTRGNEMIFEYTTRNDLSYTVEYYYNNVLDNEKTEIFENQTFKTEITEYTDKVEKGYKLENAENLPLTISTDEIANVIKVYYVTDESQRKELKYTVEYYKDGILEDSEEETKDVQYLEPENMAVNVEKINTTDKYEGYYFSNTEPEIIPDEVMNGDVIKVNYTVRTDLSYTVKCINAETGNELKPEETKENQTYNTDVTESAPEVPGYAPVEKDVTITITTGKNEIVFEYTRAELKYTVEYYYDNVINAEETEELTGKYQDTIDKYEEKCFDGYLFERIENFPLTITENPEANIIKVYYQSDESQQKELSYTVEYYKTDVEVLEDRQTVSKYVQAALPDVLNVDKTQINVTDKYYGHKVAEIKLNDEVIDELPDTVTSGDVIQIVYVVDENATKELTYIVEYYKDGVVETTEEIKQDVQVLEPDVLTVDKTKINIENKYIGYKFEKVEPAVIPDVVNNGDIIKVYYIKDEFEYSIEYYYDGVLDAENTIVQNGRVGEVINEYPSKEKEGYEFEKVENLPLTITENPEQNIINVYYALKDSQIIVKFVDKYANEEILPQEVIDGKVFENYDLNQNKKEIPEYTLVGEPEILTVRFEEEIKTYIFYYAKNSEVIVKYIERDDTPDDADNKVLAEEKISGYEGCQYTTNEKTIENYTFVASTDNTEGIMAREKIEVIYYYAQNTKVVANHIDQATGKTMDTVEYTGKVGDQYQTEAKNFENYVLIENPENENGIMTKETIVVNYYYSHVSSGVIEKHIDIMSNEILEDMLHEGLEGTPYSTKEKEFEGYEIVTNVRYYSKYVAENPEILKDNDVETVEALLEKLGLKTDDKYIPENSEGKMAINTIEVNYYYVRRAEVKVEYIDKTTNKPIMIGEEDSTVIISGHEGDAYTTELKEFSGYEIEKDIDGNPKLPENKDGKMIVTTDQNGNVSTQTLVRYYYEKTSKVVEKHIDITTGKVIKETEKIGYIGKEYETSVAELEGFEIVTNQRYYEKLVKENPDILKENGVTTLEELLQKLGLNIDNKYIPENATGKITEEITEVKYYYIRKIKVIVQYIDKETGETIQSRFVENGIIQQKDPTVIFEGCEGDNYEAKVKSFENYNLVESEYPTNEKGIMAPVIKEDGTIENTVYVTYYYIREKADVKVEYIDVVTGEKIKEADNYINNQGEEYKVEPKEIEGYTLVEERRPANESGKLTEEGATVNYYYIKKTKVIVKYVDIKTNEAIDKDTVINGHEGDDYKVQEKVIEGYSLNKISGKTSGKMTREDIIVTYYYDKKETPQNPQNPTQPSTPSESTNKQDTTSTNDNKAPTVTIKPSEENVGNKNNNSNNNEVIKTGDVGPNMYISIICVIILANIIQMIFTNKKAKIIK